MSLLDCDDQPILKVLWQAQPYAKDGMGIPLHNLQPIRDLMGRISRPTANQRAMWGTLGIVVTYTLYTFDGNVDNGMFVYMPQDKRLFRVTGPRDKSYARGSLDSFWAYPIEEVTSQVIFDTGNPDGGKQLSPSVELGSSPPPGTLPAPTNLVVSGPAPSTTLTWNFVPGAILYDVYRGTSSGGEAFLASVAYASTFLDTTGSAGPTYYYQVRARNGFAASLMSNEAHT